MADTAIDTDMQDAKRWREFCRLATFHRDGFNNRNEEGFTIRVKMPIDWDLSFVEAIDASIRRQPLTRELCCPACGYPSHGSICLSHAGSGLKGCILENRIDGASKG